MGRYFSTKPHYHLYVSVLVTPNKTVSPGLLTALWASNWWFCPRLRAHKASCQCLQVGHGRVEERMSLLLGTSWLVALGQWHWHQVRILSASSGCGVLSFSIIIPQGQCPVYTCDSCLGISCSPIMVSLIRCLGLIGLCWGSYYLCWWLSGFSWISCRHRWGTAGEIAGPDPC